MATSFFGGDFFGSMFFQASTPQEEEPILHGGLPPKFVKTKVKKREDVEAVVREAFNKVLGINPPPEIVKEVIEEAEIAVRIKLPEYDLQAEQTIRIMIENIGRQLERYKAENDAEMDDEEALLMVI